MNQSFAKEFISSLNPLKVNILNNPYIFNNVRRLIAGNQLQTKLFVKKYINTYKCKSIIDICSGTGDFSSLIDKDISYLGIDDNQNFINYAKNRYKMDKNKLFKKADILNQASFTGEKFDAVILISTMHHFSDRELDTLFEIVKKITNKIVIIADIIPNPPRLLQKIFVKLDQGKYIRTEKDKIKILKRYFKIINKVIIPSRLAIQYGIVCEV